MPAYAGTAQTEIAFVCKQVVANLLISLFAIGIKYVKKLKYYNK